MATEAELRAAVIREARSWVGTPWRHKGAIKGQCVDCAMLLVRCFIDAGVIAEFDPRPYPRAWFMHKDGEQFLHWVIERLHGCEVDNPQPGDVIVYRYGRCFAHGAILVAPQLVIHADAKIGRCQPTETFDPWLATRPQRAFNMFVNNRR